MGAARKSVFLASASLMAVAIGAGMSSTAQAACAFGTPSAGGFVVNCDGEFQQTLSYDSDGDDLSLSAPPGGSTTIFEEGRDGDDRLTLRGNDIAGLDILTVLDDGAPGLDLGDGDDEVSIDASAIDGTINGGAGDDRFTVFSTDTAGSGIAFNGDAGNDLVSVSGGSIGGFTGGTGDDTLNFTGGTINGAIAGFESVQIRGDGANSIGNTSLAISGNNDVDINVQDLLTPDLDNPETSPAFAFDLSNVSSLRATNSSISILALESGVDELSLRRSLLRVGGTLDLTAAGKGGRRDARDSTIDAFNGETTDVIRVSSIRARNVTFLIDADSAAGRSSADQLVIVTPRGQNPLTLNSIIGDNRIVINFPDTFSGGPIDIPVANVSGISSDIVAQQLARFEVVGGTNTNQLLGLELEQRGNQVVVVPTARRAPLATGISTSSAASGTNDAIDEIANNLIEGGGERIAVTENFGIFASGQFGHTWHYGYDVEGGDLSGKTSDFDVNNYSAFITGEVDLGDELGSSEVGVRVAAFGGYVQSDVTLDENLGDGLRSVFDGSGYNRGGVFGGSLSFDRVFGNGHYAYAGTTVAGFLGTTDTTSADTGGKGDYGTQGIVVSNKFGIAFAIADRLRLDTRFGVGYTYFHGDSFTDDEGTRFGATRNSYATLSFEPGVQTAVQVGNVTVTPQARLLLDYKAGYVNDASSEGIDYDLDEARYSVGGELGAGVLITENLTAGAFISAKANDDQSSLLARLAVKYQF